jgi:hypothetical protein
MISIFPFLENIENAQQANSPDSWAGSNFKVFLAFFEAVFVYSS